MTSPSEILTLTLSKPVTADALKALRESVVRTLDAGTKALLIDIDGIGTLESPTIATLIVALRECRERSAVVSLGVSRKSLLETLHITALDRIFTIVTPLAALATEPRKPSRLKHRRFVASLAAGTATLAALAASPADAQAGSARFAVTHVAGPAVPAKAGPGDRR
ncbi:MAG: STAS domain-containing protein [Candidatus Eremiobacteraeota bacterium]|nr:STAS domain-containing protein [Candidatus Eremiobacteraeota bacterium]